jgi:hypothetical protein
MPYGIDTAIGEQVDFDGYSSAVSIVNMVSPGQVMEGQQDMHVDQSWYGVSNVVSGDAVVMSVSDTSKPVEASYGTVLMWQWCHRTMDKAHFTHAPPSRADYLVRRGRSRGGGLRSSARWSYCPSCARRAPL